MTDTDLMLAKAGSVKKHMGRAKEKCGEKLADFLNDTDRQDIVLFNLQMAIQNCVDMAAHIVSEEGFGVAGSVNEMFYMLEENGYLPAEITEKMVKAAGFRNLIAHEYGRLEMEQVFKTARNDIQDLGEFLVAVFSKTGLYMDD
jgi:uncharacterized protein YutE (UPF0331/DUF86 family)